MDQGGELLGGSALTQMRFRLRINATKSQRTMARSATTLLALVAASLLAHALAQTVSNRPNTNGRCMQWKMVPTFLITNRAWSLL